MSLLTFCIALVLVCGVGCTLGMLGSGGSIITLPVLVYVAGMPVHQAVGMSLLVVGGTSGMGWFLYLRQGLFDLKAGIFFSTSGILGAWCGGRFTHAVPDRILLIMFGVLMGLVGWRMMRRVRPNQMSKSCKPVRCLLAGFGIGVLTGFFGVGGGFVILPALVWFAGLEMRAAAGTSLAIITFNAAGGLLGHWREMRVNGPVLFAFLVFAMAGMMVGNHMASRCSASGLQRGFAWSVLVVGIVVTAWNGFSMFVSHGL